MGIRLQYWSSQGPADLTPLTGQAGRVPPHFLAHTLPRAAHSGRYMEFPGLIFRPSDSASCALLPFTKSAHQTDANIWVGVVTSKWKSQETRHRRGYRSAWPRRMVLGSLRSFLHEQAKEGGRAFQRKGTVRATSVDYATVRSCSRAPRGTNSHGAQWPSVPPPPHQLLPWVARSAAPPVGRLPWHPGHQALFGAFPRADFQPVGQHGPTAMPAVLRAPAVPSSRLCLRPEGASPLEAVSQLQ